MKKAYFSPVTSLLVSLSLALGILVSDLSGYKLLTSAHAQENPCGGGGTTIESPMLIGDGLILSGITVRNGTVNGSVVEHAVIAGSVHLSGATVLGTTDVVGGNSPCLEGVIIGSGDSPQPQLNGVIIGSGDVVGGDPQLNGVIIGSGDVAGGDPQLNGVIIGSGDLTLSGVTGSATGTAVGGTLTGDDITVGDGGVITGQNLLLSGTTIDGGSINGTATSVSISPTN